METKTAAPVGATPDRDSDPAQRDAIAAQVAGRVQEALRHPDLNVRRAMLEYAFRDLGPPDIGAIYSVTKERVDTLRKLRGQLRDIHARLRPMNDEGDGG